MRVDTLLLWSLLSAFGAVGLTIIIRNAPIVRGWVMDAKKPWACNVCMPVYTVAAMLAVPTAVDWHNVLAYPAAYALAYIVLQKLAQPPGVLEIPADLLEAGEDDD